MQSFGPMYCDAESVMQPETVLIAETDEFGRTVCVWQWDGVRRLAQPVRDAASVMSLAEAAVMSGAPREDILGWLSDRAAQ